MSGSKYQSEPLFEIIPCELGGRRNKKNKGKTACGLWSELQRQITYYPVSIAHSLLIFFFCVGNNKNEFAGIPD